MAKASKDDLGRFHDYGIYMPSRTIYMGSEIVGEESESGTDALMAERIVKNLHVLDSLAEQEITILANNLGGDVMHGLAIYDAIKACRSNIVIKVFGNASSMGSIILQAADERIMSPNSVQMIHFGTLSVGGHVKTVYKQTEENKRIDSWMEKMYLEKIRQKITDFSLQRLKGMLDHDCFLTAQKSVEIGLADKVLGDDHE